MTSSFTQTFGNSPVSPASVAYAAYSFSSNLVLYWPEFSYGQPIVAARFMSLTATAGSLNVYMPDATLNSVGYDAIIFNAGSNTLNVVTYTGQAIATIASGQTYYLIMTNNATQDGTWLTVQFGVGTGSASAAALAGLGLLAVAGVLDVNFVVNQTSMNTSITSASRGQLYNWTGGSGTISLPTAASVGNGFFFMIANNGSGSATVATSGGNTIDGNANSVFSQTQSGFIISDGANWETVGKGIQNTFAVTLLNLNVAGSSNVTETSAQAENIIQQFTGILTGNIAVIVPNTVQLYFVSNQTTGAFTLTLKTASGTGIIVTQGTNAILYCDGTNVVNAFTAEIAGTLSLIAGSAASPSLSFQTSVGLGLFSPGSNLVSVASNSVEAFRLTAAASAVNFFGSIASATGNAIQLGAVGSDTNINISLVPKGNGYVACGFLDNTTIGYTVPAPANFTTLAASSTVSGLGFTAYLASPPAIGSTAPAAGHFTTLTATSSATLGVAGTTSGTVVFEGATSGSTTLQPMNAASGTLTLPAAIDQLVGRATTDTLSNKTLASPAVTGTLQLNTHGVITEINVQTFTTFTATSTYTPTSGIVYATFECWGGGGAGGGVAASSTSGAAGGGGAGGYSRKTVPAATIGASQIVTVGVGGSPGVAGNNPGGNGGNTSVGSICVANGGSGGNGAAANGRSGGGNGGAAGTGDIAGVGQYGGTAESVAASALSGTGGSTLIGSGGPSVGVAGSGANGIGNGTGGSGGVDTTTTAQTGGAGMPGFVIITEFLSV